MAIRTFLCCFSVHEGSWICGTISLLLGALRVYLQGFNLEFRQRMTEMARKQLQIDFSTLQLITILQMTVAAISMAVSVLMLVGLLKRWRWLLCPWMVWVVLEEVFSIFVIIFYAICRVQLSCSVYISEAVMLIVSVYFMLCVYSNFKQLRRQEILDRYREADQFTLEGNGFEEDPTRPLLTNRPV